jgi:hypothetical protein
MQSDSFGNYGHHMVWVSDVTSDIGGPIAKLTVLLQIGRHNVSASFHKASANGHTHAAGCAGYQCHAAL